MKANQKSKGFLQNKAGYTEVVGGLIALLVFIGVGAMIFYQITDSFEGTSDEANDTLNETEEMGTTVFGLLPIIALVLVAAVIIGVVITMGGGGSKYWWHPIPVDQKQTLRN